MTVSVSGTYVFIPLVQTGYPALTYAPNPEIAALLLDSGAQLNVGGKVRTIRPFTEFI